MTRKFTKLNGLLKRLFMLPFCLLVLLTCTAQVWAQESAVVRGRVISSENGEGLPGVNVRVKGTNQGTITNLDGEFQLSASPDATLVFSYIGFVAEEVSVDGRTQFDVSLIPDISQLQEVVVVGYGVQEKRDITGAISSVSGEELVKQASQNPVSALQGKVAGVTITNNGQPGASPQIRIRGAGSALGSSDPLYVVDGTFVDNLSFLNPADIESIEILKDASSAAIYGVRAANGVVLVTTRRGQKGKPRVDYNGFVGVQRVTNQVEMTDAQEYATLINERENSEVVPADYPTTDWYDQILQTAMIHNHQVTASGGSDNITYSASAGYLNQEGIVKGNDYERITARLQTDFQLNENIKLGYNGIFYNYNSTDIPNEVLYQAYVAPPIIPVFETSGRYGDSYNYGVGDFANPQASLDWFNQISNGQQLTANVFGEAKFLNDFTFRSSLGINYGVDEYRNYRSQDSLTTVQYASRSLLTQSRSKSSSWLWENTLTYQKTVGDHNITALLGISSQENQFESLTGSVNDVDYNSEANLYLDLGDPETLYVNADGDRYTFMSYFGRINYTFKEKYLLTTTLRYDASSKFPSSDRWEYFPSVGLGWRVIEEDFMQSQNIFDNLKVRASWGKLGNNNIPSSLYILPVSTNARYGAIWNGTYYAGRNITEAVSPSLFWEVVKETDLGIEMGFLDNRLSVEADWYNKITENAIFGLTPLGSIGLTGEIKGNYATFRNRGLEVVTNWTDNVGNDFSYNVGFNLSVNRNKVTDIATGNNMFYSGNLPVGGNQVSVTRIGDPIGSFYGYEVAGIFQNEQEVAASAQSTTNALPGDFKYRDQNGDGVIDEQDKVIIGNPNPGFIYGLNTGFRYKNFDLQVDVQGVADVDIYNANKNVRYGNENFTQEFYDNRWHGEGTSNTYPSANLTGQNLNVNDYYVESGDYFRIRNLQLGYNLPSGLVERWKMQKLRVYINAQNPVTWFSYSGFSPEVGSSVDNTNTDIAAGVTAVSQGIDRNVYPLSATYNFGVNITF